MIPRQAKNLKETLKKMGDRHQVATPVAESPPPMAEAGSMPFDRLLRNQTKFSLATETTVDVDLIDLDPRRKRKLTPNERARLKASIIDDGLLSPITLEKTTNGRYRTVAGHNRLEICAEDLKWKTIPARIVEISTSSEKAAFISNLLQPSLSCAELYQGFKILQSDANGCRMSNRQISKETGYSESFIGQILTMDKLDPKLVNAMYQAKVLVGSNVVRKFAMLIESKMSEPESDLDISTKAVTMIQKAYSQVFGEDEQGFSDADMSKDFWNKKLNEFIKSEGSKPKQQARQPRASQLDLRKLKPNEVKIESSTVSVKFADEKSAIAAAELIKAHLKI